MPNPQRRFLIVDDFPMIRTMIKKSLSDLGYKQTSEAIDGVQAMEMLEESVRLKVPYDIVFLDWNMPRMTGIEVVEKCKALPALSKIPIIIISAERERSNLVRALKAGANDYILKPFSPQTLSEKLERILNPTAAPKAANE